MTSTLEINNLLALHGLCSRGAFHPAPEDGVPDGAAALVLVGHVGQAMWEAFKRERRPEPQPLDSWSRRVVGDLAQRLGALALFPFDGPPWLPFQRWAMKAEGLHPSPIGPLIHSVYGPWHGYRGALSFARPPDGMPPSHGPGRNLCADCASKPCLSACPAGVFDAGRYDVPRCVGHLRRAGNECLPGGCLARRACPIGREHAYGREQAGFHTAAFLAGMDS
jgi:hypothetical protein